LGNLSAQRAGDKIKTAPPEIPLDTASQLHSLSKPGKRG
jgi:hypothetical protein